MRIQAKNEQEAIRIVSDIHIQDMANSLSPEEDYIEFSGWNCNDYGDNECFGWDGISRRCECGNRRVGWVAEKTKIDGVYDVEAIAY